MDAIILLALACICVLVMVVIHRDGVMVGDERGRNTKARTLCSHCRVYEGTDTIRTHEFYNQEER